MGIDDVVEKAQGHTKQLKPGQVRRIHGYTGQGESCNPMNRGSDRQCMVSSLAGWS